MGVERIATGQEVARLSQSMRTLRTLDVRETSFSETAIKNLQQQLPHLKIVK